MAVVDTVGTAAGVAVVSGVGDGTAPQPSGKSVQESLDHQSALESSLKAGLSVISQDQTVTFTRYVKCVLPLDGFVFWVKAELLSASALANTSAWNTFEFNQAPAVLETAPQLTAFGSVHITTTNQQDADESFAINEVVFTSKSEVQGLNNISPHEMWIATWQGFKFAFSERRGYYRQANLYHYRGHAVYPVLESQIIDDVATFNTREVVVSNSLPIWLSLSRYAPVYPSFLVPDNIRPPYVSVFIDPEGTRAIQSAPYLDRNTSSHWQLATDRVRLTTFGLRNNQALDLQDYILACSLVGDFGIMNMPIWRDEHRTQTELSALAQKKTMLIDVSYYQTRMRDVARQLILEVIPTFYVGGGVNAVIL